MVDASSKLYFREVQHFRQTRMMAILAPLFLGAFILLGYFLFKDFFSSVTPGGVPLSHTAPGIIGAPIYLLGVGIYFLVFYVMKMKTEVRSDGLHIRFFPLTRRFIGFQEIRSSEVRTYRPIREYGGWGVRGGPGDTGSAFNVSGNRGVQLVLSDGKRLLIGSQKAEELATAIRVGAGDYVAE